MSPYQTAIITDSTCDIPASLIEKYEILVVPQIIVWGREELRDRVDIQPEAFYRRLASDRQLPTTEVAAAADFQRVFQHAKERGACEALLLTVSSAMSRTFQVAQAAAKGFNLPIHILDSRGLSMGLGWQVLAAARVRAAGGNLQEMIAKTRQVRQELVLIACLDSLEFLYRSGRIGNVSRLFGAILSIKPLLCTDHKTGRVEPAGRARTQRKALDLLYQRFFEGLQRQGPLRVAVLHGDAPDQARAVAARIQAEFPPAELLVNTTGPALGIHTGPRALALCGYIEV